MRVQMQLFHLQPWDNFQCNSAVPYTKKKTQGSRIKGNKSHLKAMSENNHEITVKSDRSDCSCVQSVESLVMWTLPYDLKKLKPWLRDYMSGLCYEGYLHIQHIMEEEHEHISKRILWRPKMVSPMELDELRAIFL
ncbi:hypothetical protein MtrunA17_Chr2g0333531 [Medicago truncatula]|uniref:Uncharacterized protein n=1 Tax=Medicago truncatula TaxID=3880 RepID=G7IMA5_MEDTR|nr:uncharacterized protein LOC11430023 [Medicago truncatula]XP_024629058.1 uncharacterized protein LOC25500229 [Medicago truncatula]XP_039684880.1 uncharacterized protein LOC25500229 [Medicago truncatula]AES68215.2 hypothetical protein MTR_2g104470 [Medicago truncatula]RHN76566.1 hypothetical protein MtrunA17_Chr2g0333531 [Medicago truncatula]